MKVKIILSKIFALRGTFDIYRRSQGETQTRFKDLFWPLINISFPKNIFCCWNNPLRKPKLIVNYIYNFLCLTSHFFSDWQVVLIGHLKKRKNSSLSPAFCRVGLVRKNYWLFQWLIEKEHLLETEIVGISITHHLFYRAVIQYCYVHIISFHSFLALNMRDKHITDSLLKQDLFYSCYYIL